MLGVMSAGNIIAQCLLGTYVGVHGRMTETRQALHEIRRGEVALSHEKPEDENG